MKTRARNDYVDLYLFFVRVGSWFTVTEERKKQYEPTTDRSPNRLVVRTSACTLETLG